MSWSRRHLFSQESIQRKPLYRQRPRVSLDTWSRSSTIADWDTRSIGSLNFDIHPAIGEEPEQSDSADIHALRRLQSFQEQVTRKARVYLIGQQEAEEEVLVDRLIREQNGVNRALLHVCANVITEIKVLSLVTALLHRGANAATVDLVTGMTSLHHAVKRNLPGVCQRLLDHNAEPLVADHDNNTPYNIALDAQNDCIASLLLSYLPHKVVRSIYNSDGINPAKYSFRTLLKLGMERTILSILDCQIDESGSSEDCTVYYQLLDADECGRAPSDPKFNSSSRSCLHLLAKTGNRDLIYHDVVRLLVMKKWKGFAKWRIEINAAAYLFSLFSLSYVAIIGSDTQDPMKYGNALQYSRGIFELWGFGVAGFTLVLELNRMRKQKLAYWREAFNYIDLASVCLLTAVVPLRLCRQREQWFVFSIGYLLWTLRIFKFAAVFRQTGAYAQILWKIITQDFVQFLLVFTIVLVAFSGAFLLALRGENSLQKKEETRSFFWILFLGVRTLIEAQPVIEYTGQEGYQVLGTCLMVLYLLVCTVVLLNILIAQLSDTYQNIQGDAHRALELSRAWIVSRVELDSIFVGPGYRVKHYTDHEVIVDPLDQLEKWNKAQIHEQIKRLQEISDKLDVQELQLRTIRTQMVHQEYKLKVIRSSVESKVQDDPLSDNNGLFQGKRHSV